MFGVRAVAGGEDIVENDNPEVWAPDESLIDTYLTVMQLYYIVYKIIILCFIGTLFVNYFLNKSNC